VKVIVCFVLTGFLLIGSVRCQNHLSETERLYSLCKVWGYLKYYHPGIAKGKIDWDEELIQKIPQVDSLSTMEEINAFYLEWINSLGQIKGCSECGNFKNENAGYNFDLSWIENETLFTKEVGEKLRLIEKNRTKKRHHYFTTRKSGNVLFKNPRSKKVEVFPSYEVRLADVFSFWNSIEYFFPYKYVMDENWDSILIASIPKIKYAADSVEYHNAYLKILQAVNDGHISNPSPVLRNSVLGYGRYAFKVDIIDSNVIVSRFYQPIHSSSGEICIGDIILEINGVEVKKIIKKKSDYTLGSNDIAHLNYLSRMILKNEYTTPPISHVGVFKVQRGDSVFIDTVPMDYTKIKPRMPDSLKYYIIGDNIGYVNLNEVYPKDVDEMMKSLMKTNAIIFDDRGYPNLTLFKIAEYLNDERKDFAKFTLPDEYYPGKFVWAPRMSACGKKNDVKYEGKVIILVNEMTQSHAEFTCMCFQTHPNSVTVGSQTAGADGNVSQVYLMGGRTTYMSGIGVYYPDGTPTQRVGVKIDVEVKPSIEGLQKGRDEVLEKAIDIANQSP
jgi:carboxyl-terminal processing protease